MNSSNVYELGWFRLELVEGDITNLSVDAIVNAANTDLILGAGVAGAIRKKGGPSIQEECNKLAPINTGDAVITKGGNLQAKFVIHTAGPIYFEYPPQEADDLLRRAIENSFQYIYLKRLKSIAFPAISAGIYGFPVDRCAEIMIETVINYMNCTIENKKLCSNSSDDIIRIIFCLYGKENYTIFLEKFQSLTKGKKENLVGTPNKK